MSKRFPLEWGLALAACWGLIGWCAGCGGGRPAIKHEYRMQVTVGPTTYWGMGAARFAELAREKTGGRINVKPYYGSQLLRGAQLNSAQMVSVGAVDLALESTINAAPVVPELNLFNLPFFMQSYSDLDRVERGAAGSALFDLMRQKGVEPLAWGENGFRQLTNSKHDVKQPSDLKGLKIRVVGSPVFIDIFRALGADPVNMNWGDAVTGFQQGTVDGQENPMGILLPVQIHQYHKHLTLWNYLADPLILYWNKQQWNRFPADIRDALREAADEAMRYQKALVRAGLDGGHSLEILNREFGGPPDISDPVAHLHAAGMTITQLSHEQVTAFSEQTKGVREQWEARVGERIMGLAHQDLEGKDAAP